MDIKIDLDEESFQQDAPGRLEALRQRVLQERPAAENPSWPLR